MILYSIHDFYWEGNVENHVSCNLCLNVTSQFYSDKFKTVFLFTYCTGKFVNFYTGLVCITEIIKAILRYFHWIIFKQMDIISKIQSIMFTENYNKIQFFNACHLRWNCYSKSLISNFCMGSVSPAFKIKKLVLVGKIPWRFDIIFHIWLTNLFFIKYSCND